MIRLLLLPILAFLLFPGHFEESDEGILHLRIENIKDPQGTIWVGVYDSEENFLIKGKAILKGVKVKGTGTMDITVEQVKFGQCAVAIMHDVNGNGDMDRNWLGIPVEPYAFSRKPRSKWRLPRFGEVVFDFEPQHDEISVVLDRW